MKSSAVVDTRVIYCGDNIEQLAKLPDACLDLIYIDPPFNSNRNYEVFWGETKEKRAFDDRHASQCWQAPQALDFSPAPRGPTQSNYHSGCRVRRRGDFPRLRPPTQVPVRRQGPTAGTQLRGHQCRPPGLSGCYCCPQNPGNSTFPKADMMSPVARHTKPSAGAESGSQNRSILIESPQRPTT